MSDLLSTPEVKRIVGRLRYTDWDFTVEPSYRQRPETQLNYYPLDGWKLQAHWVCADSSAEDGATAAFHSRVWFLPRDVDESNIVKAAWGLVLAAIEHEAREAFWYDGSRLFHPHINVDQLKAVQAQRYGITPAQRAAQFDARQETFFHGHAMSKAPGNLHPRAEAETPRTDRMWWNGTEWMNAAPSAQPQGNLRPWQDAPTVFPPYVEFTKLFTEAIMRQKEQQYDDAQNGMQQKESRLTAVALRQGVY